MDVIARYVAAMWQARTWTAIAYLLIGLPVSIVLFTYAVTMYAVGASLVIIWVGILILLAMQASLRPIGAFERGMANWLLGASIPPPPPLRRPEGKVRGTLAAFHDAPSWRVLAWVMARIVLAPIGFALAIVAAVVPVTLVAGVVLALLHVFGLADLWGMGADGQTAEEIVDTTAFWVALGSPVALAIAPAFAWIAVGLGALHTRFARWALGSCERERAEAAMARAQLAEEQVRIDQELHDSIGHMITMNIVQAGAGAHVFDSDPEFARQALRTIEERGRAAMGELDRIIATIRGDDAGERAPLPGIADIPALIEASRHAGMAVDARLDTTAAPPAIGRAAFGIVREALTNAARHAPGAPVSVVVAREDDAVGIDVENGPGGADLAPPARPDRPSRGVSGMRDRVTLLGGRTAIGPVPGGGYRVRALLPLSASIGPVGDGSPWDDLREGVRA